MESPLLFPNSGGGYVDFRNFNRAPLTLLQLPRVGCIGTRRHQRRGHRVQRAPLERGRSETAQKFAFSALAATTACPFCVRHLARRVLSATQTRDMQGFSGSPLTDSNRRPPPSHGGFRFRGVVRRIVLAEPFPRYFRDSSAAR